MTNHTEIDENARFHATKFLRSEAALLESIQRVDDSRAWATFGFTSVFDYCVRRLKLSESTTSAFICVARKAKTVPLLKDAVVQGSLTLSQAKRVVSVIEPANATLWVEKASQLKQRELEREVAAALPSPAPKARLKAVGGQMSELTLVIPEAMRKKLERLQEIRGGSLLEAFDHALEQVLKRECPLRRAQRNFGKCRNRKSSAPKPRSSRNARPRPPTAAQVTHAVITRDNAQCTFRYVDGSRCASRRWLHAHHVTPVSHGGASTAENLALLCSQHHRFLHSALSPSTPLVPKAREKVSEPSSWCETYRHQNDTGSLRFADEQQPQPHH